MTYLGKKRLLNLLNEKSGLNLKMKDCIYHKRYYGAETLAYYPYAVVNPGTGYLFYQVSSAPGRDFVREVVYI